MKPATPKGTVVLGCAALALSALAGCGSTGASSPATRTATPSSATGTAHGSPGPVTLDESADRTHVTVASGTTVRVDLHSTYWSPVTSSDPGLLAPVGSPSTAATSSCRPGAGCGTVTTAFVARAGGSVQLTARRTSCGEAKPCPPDQQTFAVEVEITR